MAATVSWSGTGGTYLRKVEKPVEVPEHEVEEDNEEEEEGTPETQQSS